MLGLLVLPETHLPSIQRQYRRRLPLPHGGAAHNRKTDLGILKTLRRAILLPTKVSGHLPAFLILLLFGIFNGLINMILSSLGSVYQDAYHFPARTAGLSSLGIGAGGLSSLAATTKELKHAVASTSTSSRLSTAEASLLFIASILPISAVGLLWYGWALQSQTF